MARAAETDDLLHVLAYPAEVLADGKGCGGAFCLPVAGWLPQCQARWSSDSILATAAAGARRLLQLRVGRLSSLSS